MTMSSEAYRSTECELRTVLISIAKFAEGDVRVFMRNKGEALSRACVCIAYCASLEIALKYGSDLGVREWTENTELNVLFRYDGEVQLKAGN